MSEDHDSWLDDVAAAGIRNAEAKHGLRQRPGDQPLPVPNQHPDIQSQVIADIQARRELGIQRYGTALQPHNGRDMLVDAYEEAMDLTIYLKGCIVERDSAA